MCGVGAGLPEEVENRAELSCPELENVHKYPSEEMRIGVVGEIMNT